MATASSLSERLAFQRRVDQSDGYGNKVGAWQTEFTADAQVKPIRGREEVLARRLQGVQPVVLTVRASALTRRVTPEWRAVRAPRDGWPEVIYNIRSLADMEGGNAWIDMLAEAGPAT